MLELYLFNSKEILALVSGTTFQTRFLDSIMKPRILLTGKNGQIGAELANLLPRLGDLAAFNHQQLDLSKPEQIRKVIREIHPQVIVNAAAFTNVDQAEKYEPEAQAINAEAPGLMAEEAKRIGALLVHYSTDYVFDGTKSSPYEEDDETNPISAYGRTKLGGEQAIQEVGSAHLIFRTAWVYGLTGKNFLLTVLRLATEREELRVVHDQLGAPTWSREVAKGTFAVLSKLASRNEITNPAANGIYHMTATGQGSWYDFAQAILSEASYLGPEVPWYKRVTGGRSLIARCVTPIRSAEYVTPAKRPAFSVLSTLKLREIFGEQLPPWRTQLRDAFSAGQSSD
jgi:dTDP-4-dehydrorhamnose reductase